MKDYVIIEFKGKEYCVCRYVCLNGDQKLFVIDAEDLDDMLEEKQNMV